MAARGSLTHGVDLRPALVHHASGGHEWVVVEILGHWQAGLTAPERLADAGAVERWRLLVSGPLPHRPAERGRFVMVAETYGNRPGWWLSLG